MSADKCAATVRNGRFRLNTNLLPFTPPGSCDVVMVMTNARVSEVGYAAIDGGALPLGRECLFPVERCVKAP